VIRAGFRYGDDAPMAIIELVDRDVEAKKVDIKKKTKEVAKPVTESQVKVTDKKTKSKK
jgi:large subunit ribosomal protein L17